MRLFIGIPLAPEVIDALEKLSQSLRSAGDGLPLEFALTRGTSRCSFSEKPQAKRLAVSWARLRDVRSPAVPVQLDGTGFFERAGVFFAGVRVSAQMLGLENLVLAATAQCGFVAEDRPFHPHVTLARAKGDNRMKALRRLKQRVKENPGVPTFAATEFLLYEALLGAGGSRYEVRERFPLGS